MKKLLITEFSTYFIYFSHEPTSRKYDSLAKNN